MFVMFPHLVFDYKKCFLLQELKAHWRSHKTRTFREINSNGYKTNFKALGYEHFMTCFKPSWDIAFSKDLNMVGCIVEGMILFTHHALWRKVEECRLMDSSFSLSTSPGSLPPSQFPLAS